MPPIEVVSTTESKEAVQASTGAKATEDKKEETKSAPAAQATEQNTTAESETAETEAEENEKDETEESESKMDADKADDSEQDKPKKKGGFQRRIDKLNARNTAAQARIEALEQLLASKDAGAAKNEKAETKPAAAEGKPNPDAFDTHAEYVEALTDWKTEQKLNERDQKLEKSKLQIEQDRLFKTHSERVKSFSETVDDFDEVVAEVDDVQVSPTVKEIVVTSENGPALMYELAKNREEFERINKLSPLAAARELGKIESKITSKPSESKPEPKKTTKAPQPITPVGSKGGAVKKSIFDPDLSQSEYEALRAKQRSA